MAIPRIYQPIALSLQQEMILDDDASHHVARVLRMQVKERVVIFNGDGKQYEATIVAMTKRAVTVFVQKEVAGIVESPIALSLVQGIAKGEKMDWIIQKAVELGVSSIYPLQTEHGNVRLSAEREAKRMMHWQKVAIGACEQSGRVRVPRVHPIMSLSQYLSGISSGDVVFVLSPHVEGKLNKTLAASNISVLIGPEGGLSEAEMKEALDHGCKPLNLGARVLRTETAAITALSVLQYVFGDLK